MLGPVLGGKMDTLDAIIDLAAKSGAVCTFAGLGDLDEPFHTPSSISLCVEIMAEASLKSEGTVYCMRFNYPTAEIAIKRDRKTT
jgi:hypothetical protein